MLTTTITKRPPAIPPNLANYETTAKTFTWEQAKIDLIKNKELTYFSDGTQNLTFNALDKHLGTPLENKTAMIWTDETEEKIFTFGDLSKLTNQFANILKNLNVQKGDRVFMFLPRVPELYICFLGALKRGAIASNLFAAFGYEALEDRLKDSGAKILVTTNELKERVNKVKDRLPNLKHIILVNDKNSPGRKDSSRSLPLKNITRGVEYSPARGQEVSKEWSDHEVSYHNEMQTASEIFDCAHMTDTDPSYMLYTSGTTGKPKGVVHSHGDIVQQHLSTKWILDLKPDDIYWCTADPGWVTGVVYGIIGPWSNGITQVVYNGRFDPDKWYAFIEKNKVTMWYTAPTAIRMLMTDPVILKRHNLKSLRYIASVGEPLNPEAIVWGEKNLNLPIHDNYWQTETGSIVIANYPCLDIKPGSMGKPFPGIHAAIINENGQELPNGTEGDIALKRGWPSMMDTIWDNKEKYDNYFRDDWYITGDKGKRDEDGYFWFIGRDDDVIKTAGERVGPFEVESALIAHPAVAEAGVIGKPDELRGNIIKAFIELNPGFTGSTELKEEIQAFVKKELAGHAYPREIEFRDKLPKTRSGKIMRRVLKKQELGEDVGDVSTMEEY